MKFLRQQVNYKKRIAKNWRKPRGHHSKLREKRAGLRAIPDVGYRSPRVERLKQEAIVMITNLNDVKDLVKGVIVRLSAKIGNKKKAEILEACIKKGLIVLNYRRPAETISKIKDSFAKRVADKKKRFEKKKPIKKEEVAAKEEPKKKVVVKKKTEEATTSEKKVVVKKEGENK
ncbi:MAG TPA: eL32 family ribosomal protein [Candidatus Nanoarchaeia archaeon]|nr:eL32 family ribosomal protein [Candidatus Nanoarchaeia archaeon]